METAREKIMSSRNKLHSAFKAALRDFTRETGLVARRVEWGAQTITNLGDPDAEKIYSYHDFETTINL